MKSPLQIKEEINNKLNDNNFNLRVVSYSGSLIELNNGLSLNTRNKCLTFKRHILENNTAVDLGIIDDLYSTDEDTRQITKSYMKSYIASKAAKSNWDINREKLVSSFKGRSVWNKGMKGVYKNVPMSEEQKRGISVRNSGKNNGMYGKVLSDGEKKHKSECMKQLIVDGKFTPNSNNRNTHWKSSFNEKSFRSSWEALYQCHMPDSQYEKLRIPYEFDGKKYIYIVDFVDHKNKVVAEVKPSNLLKDRKTIAKLEALNDWSKKNGYSFDIVDEKFITNNIPFPNKYLNKFDEGSIYKLKTLYNRYLDETC